MISFKEIKTGKTFGQMTNREKNQISHRGIALKKMCILLNKKIMNLKGNFIE